MYKLVGTWHDTYRRYIRYFRVRIYRTFSIFSKLDLFHTFKHYFITWCKNLTKMQKQTFQVFNTAYYLILKHFYRAVHVVQSAVLLLLLFIVAPMFWNTQLKHKPFNWHHVIQCCNMKISKISDIFHPCIEATDHALYILLLCDIQWA